MHLFTYWIVIDLVFLAYLFSRICTSLGLCLLILAVKKKNSTDYYDSGKMSHMVWTPLLPCTSSLLLKAMKTAITCCVIVFSTCSLLVCGCPSVENAGIDQHRMAQLQCWRAVSHRIDLCMLSCHAEARHTWVITHRHNSRLSNVVTPRSGP